MFLNFFQMYTVPQLIRHGLAPATNLQYDVYLNKLKDHYKGDPIVPLDMSKFLAYINPHLEEKKYSFVKCTILAYKKHLKLNNYELSHEEEQFLQGCRAVSVPDTPLNTDREPITVELINTTIDKIWDMPGESMDKHRSLTMQILTLHTNM